MSKRKYPGYTAEFKKKISRLVAEKSADVEFREFKKWFPDQGFKSIWLKENENFVEQDPYIFCDNVVCRMKKTTDRVS